jgi:putative membrane protein
MSKRPGSIEGQRTPVLVVPGEGGLYVLIDGFGRLAALSALERVTGMPFRASAARWRPHDGDEAAGGVGPHPPHLPPPEDPMNDRPQAHLLVRPEDLQVRDWLAFDRTRMANERTLLAYLRTALGLLIAGVALVRIYPGRILELAVGCVSIGLGLGALGVGVARFRRVRARYASLASHPAVRSWEIRHGGDGTASG